MGAQIEIPDDWARWELKPIQPQGRRTANERMILSGKFLQGMASRKVLERPPGSRLRKRFISAGTRAAFGELTRFDEVETLLHASYADDCEMTYDEMFPEMGAGVQRGVDEILRYLVTLNDAFSKLTYQPLEVFDPGGPTFASRVRVDAVGRASGIEVSLMQFQVLTFRDGKIWRQWGFREWPDALSRILVQRSAQVA